MRYVFALVLFQLSFLSNAIAESESHAGVASALTPSNRPTAVARPTGFRKDDLYSVILGEYKSCENNYEDAKDGCWIRAQKMADKLLDLAKEKNIDPLGKDGILGTDDDTIKKIIIRYPSGARWWYHIATCAVQEDGTPLVCDPIGGTIEPYSEMGWGERFAHGYKVCKTTTEGTPNSGECTIQMFPLTKYSPSNKYSSIQEISAAAKRDQYRLNGYIASSKSAGNDPYPTKDSDGDGVPDTIDSCNNTPSGSKVDHTGCVKN